MAENTILVVDDNSMNLKLMSHVLGGRGYEVVTALNAAEALAAVSASDPRLILLDIQLPDVDGLTLASQLKSAEATRHTPIIAVTAYAMKGDADKARASGVDVYITKPIDKTSLRELVASYMRRDPKPAEARDR